MPDLHQTLERLKEYGLEIIDTHVHPFDVMGVLRYEKSLIGRSKDENFLVPTLPERLHHNSLSIVAIKSLFKVSPSIVRNSIAKSFKYSGQQRLEDEMLTAGVDRCVLIPIEPTITTKNIADNFKSNKFLLLGSVDIRGTEVNSIERVIKTQIATYGIKGIKLHPNLQNFYPQPNRNTNEINEKLENIYRIAGELGLYILFHTGYTNLLPEQKLAGSTTHKALLNNFCDLNGRSEVFEKLTYYNVPVILAHSGHYAVIRNHLHLVRLIHKTYSNVFFDTAGISPKVIRQVLEIVGSKRLIFGSDALYDRMVYKIKFVLSAVARADIDDTKEATIISILGNNFKKFFLHS